VTRRPDLVSIVAGLCVLGLGVVLLLDATGSFDLGFTAFGPLACGALGAILLASGLTGPR
jgi:hypothetical protein